MFEFRFGNENYERFKHHAGSLARNMGFGETLGLAAEVVLSNFNAKTSKGPLVAS